MGSRSCALGTDLCALRMSDECAGEGKRSAPRPPNSPCARNSSRKYNNSSENGCNFLESTRGRRTRGPQRTQCPRDCVF